MDSIAEIAPRDSQIINELISQVTQVLDSPKPPRDSEIINELTSRVTLGLDSPNSP